MIAVADTSFVVAVGNKQDAAHVNCTRVYHQHEIILVPQSTFAEVAYLLTRSLGNLGLANFLFGLPETRYRIIPLEPEDIFRTAEILKKYADARLDFVDATVIAVAERLNASRILTLD